MSPKNRKHNSFALIFQHPKDFYEQRIQKSRLLTHDFCSNMNGKYSHLNPSNNVKITLFNSPYINPSNNQSGQHKHRLFFDMQTFLHL